MKKISKSIYTAAFWLSVILLAQLMGCKSNYSEDIPSTTMPSTADESIYLDIMPSEVTLGLGRSILIENGNTVFKFDAILQLSENNSSVRLLVSYDNGTTKTIVLNTVDIPQTYSLENGYNHVIHLKEVTADWIMFTYNTYGRL
jgi:hypothetical protein